jgi:hypothetical protein
MSKYLLFNANSAIFQLYHGENKLIWDDDEVSFDMSQSVLLLSVKGWEQGDQECRQNPFCGPFTSHWGLGVLRVSIRTYVCVLLDL